MKGFTLKTQAEQDRFEFNTNLASMIGIYTFEDLMLFIRHKEVKDEFDLTTKLYIECIEAGIFD